MVDRPPPSRFQVVEKGGRLVVIDRESGRTPPSAAERMEAYDRARGVEPVRPFMPSNRPERESAARAESAQAAQLAPMTIEIPPSPPVPALSVPVAGHAPSPAKPTPWIKNRASAPEPGRAAQNARPAHGDQRKTIVTGKWWDAKGPRTIALGPLGQTRMRSGLLAVAGAMIVAAVILLILSPIIFVVVAFILVRFARYVFAPIGAGIIDKALAEPD